jgi:hypothetical protein
MPRKRGFNEERRREINREAWQQVDIMARDLFEQLRRILLEEAGLDAPRRRTRARRRVDPLRKTAAEMLAAGGFDHDPALRELAKAFLQDPGDARRRWALYKRLGLTNKAIDAALDDDDSV